MWGWQFRSWCLALGMAPPTPHWVVEGGTQKFQKQKKCWTWQHWDIECHRNTCVTLTIDVHNELEGKRRSVGSYAFTTSFTVLNCLLTVCIIKFLNDDPHWQVNLLAYIFLTMWGWQFRSWCLPISHSTWVAISNMGQRKFWHNHIGVKMTHQNVKVRRQCLTPSVLL